MGNTGFGKRRKGLARVLAFCLAPFAPSRLPCCLGLSCSPLTRLLSFSVSFSLPLSLSSSSFQPLLLSSSPPLLLSAGSSLLLRHLRYFDGSACAYVHVHFLIWDAGGIMCKFDQVGSNPISGCQGAQVTGSPSLFSFSPSSPLLPFSPSPSPRLLLSFSFSLLLLSSPSLLSPSPRERKRKEKSPPQGRGLGRSPSSQMVSTESTAEEKNF
jgi:hypothetical protein